LRFYGYSRQNQPHQAQDEYHQFIGYGILFPSFVEQCDLFASQQNIDDEMNGGSGNADDAGIPQANAAQASEIITKSLIFFEPINKYIAMMRSFRPFTPKHVIFPSSAALVDGIISEGKIQVKTVLNVS
jgi:hypothetical protein